MGIKSWRNDKENWWVKENPKGSAIREQSKKCYTHDINYKLCYKYMKDYVNDKVLSD